MMNQDKLQQWLLHSSLGRYFLRSERIFYHNVVPRIFGYYSLQIDFPQINFLQGNTIPNHYVINHNIICSPTVFPVASNSIDLIICPHTFEFVEDQELLIKELHRILIPNGTLIITAFNANSIFKPLLGKQLNKHNIHGLINLNRLKSHLINNGFNIEGGRFLCYRIPINHYKFLKNTSWLDKMGDRWLPTFANTFALTLSKQEISPTLIRPNFNHDSHSIKPKVRTADLCNKNQFNHRYLIQPKHCRI